MTKLEELPGYMRKQTCKLDGFKPSSLHVALAVMAVYDLGAMEDGALRRWLRKAGSPQELAPPQRYPLRMRGA